MARSLRSLTHSQIDIDKEFLVVLRLHSDALLRDSEGRQTLALDGAMLSDQIRSALKPTDGWIEPEKITLLAQFVRGLQVSGWQTAWKLPREVLMASSMGGLYVFSVRSALADIDRLAAGLDALEFNGIGEMREDGYGQIVVCDPFHLEVNPL